VGELVAIGKVLRVHGLRGDVRVRSLSDVPDRFETLTQVTVEGPGGARRPLAVRAVRPMARDYLVAFEGIDTPEAAAPLVGSLLQIAEDRSAPLPDGQYYQHDLVGMEVRTEEGMPLGTLADIFPTGANAVFVVRGADGREHLIPATREVVRAVDVGGRLMTIRRMPGLLNDGATNEV
jgi:16S rRNA processing protein RimM